MRRLSWVVVVIITTCVGVYAAASIDGREDFSRRIVRDVVKPELDLANRIAARKKAGETYVGDTELIGRADALSEKALAYADEARAKWCRTEQTGDFWQYMAAQHELLDIDFTCQYLRTGDSHLMEEAIHEGSKVQEALTKMGS